MRLARQLPVALAAVMLTASAALAADPIFIPPPAPAPPPLPVAYDWGGFYGGLHSGALLLYGAGVQAGFNIQRGNVVFGFEGRFGGIIGAGPPPVLYAGAGGKIGLAGGPTGNRLVYVTGAGGVAFQGGTFAPFYIFGGGVALGVTPRVSVFGEIDALGVPGAGGCCFGLFVGGVNFHFGN
jgi:hypothetical protein